MGNTVDRGKGVRKKKLHALKLVISSGMEKLKTGGKAVDSLQGTRRTIRNRERP